MHSFGMLPNFDVCLGLIQNAELEVVQLVENMMITTGIPL